MRLSTSAKLIERITIKIKLFDTGKWEWKVRQRFIKEPRIKMNDMLKILDEIKAEILAAEGKEEKKEEIKEEVAGQTVEQGTPDASNKKNTIA
ncbi:MAG: hypothetical protein IMZ43_08645 [Thermoplasmata archaeon]|nr:hypothetical protein [Thermoplasmata archaeon]